MLSASPGALLDLNAGWRPAHAHPLTSGKRPNNDQQAWHCTLPRACTRYPRQSPPRQPTTLPAKRASPTASWPCAPAAPACRRRRPTESEGAAGGEAVGDCSPALAPSSAATALRAPTKSAACCSSERKREKRGKQSNKAGRESRASVSQVGTDKHAIQACGTQLLTMAQAPRQRSAIPPKAAHPPAGLYAQ